MRAGRGTRVVQTPAWLDWARKARGGAVKTNRVASTGLLVLLLLVLAGTGCGVNSQGIQASTNEDQTDDDTSGEPSKTDTAAGGKHKDDEEDEEAIPVDVTALENDEMSIPKDADVLNDHAAFEVVDNIPLLPRKREKGADGHQRHGDAATALILGYAASRVPPVKYECRRVRQRGTFRE